MMTKMINNPVLTGFHPDPSICRVGDDYYIATSTFQWFPGVEIHKSRDLVHWQRLGGVLDDTRLLNMTGVPDSGGVWAPCLSYADGRFYLIYSNVKTYRNYFKDVDNYLTSSENILGPWEDPIYLNSSGFDPSLFHDDDGKKYVLNQIWDHRDKQRSFAGIALQEYDAKAKAVIGAPVNIFKGSEIGSVEGPNLYKIDGMYYLICAEGGTFYGHAVTVARSEKITGPYEISPYHPLLTSAGHPELRLQKCGHGSIVQTKEGEWYLAHLCGRPGGNGERCMLGRETAIQRLRRTPDNWFKLDNHSGFPEDSVPAPDLPAHRWEEEPEKMTFPGKLPIGFKTLRIPLDEKWMAYDTTRESLILYGKESMESLHTQSLVGIRRDCFNFRAETKMRFGPVNMQQSAGMALYYDTTNYFYLNISWDENRGRILQLLVCDHGEISMGSDKITLPEDIEAIFMRLVVSNDIAEFYWSPDGREYHPVGGVQDATTLSDDYYDQERHGLRFTGTFITLCCQDTSGQRCPAEFDYLIYHRNGEEYSG